MFDSKDTDSYYSEAIKDAAINNNNLKDNNNAVSLILSLSFVGLISYFGYNYFQNIDTDAQKTKVMGVTHTKDGINYTDEIGKLGNSSNDTEYSSQLMKYMDKEIKDASQRKKITSDDSKGKKRWRDIVVVVQKGDTLATLAKRYYNDSTAYDKIIRNNKELRGKSHTIYPGQKLRISQRY